MAGPTHCIHGISLLQGPACTADFQRMVAGPISRLSLPIRQHLDSMQLGFLQRCGTNRADNLPCTATGGGGGSGVKLPPGGGSGGGGEGSGEGDDADELLSKKQACTDLLLCTACRVNSAAKHAGYLLLVR